MDCSVLDASRQEKMNSTHHRFVFEGVDKSRVLETERISCRKSRTNVFVESVQEDIQSDIYYSSTHMCNKMTMEQRKYDHCQIKMARA